MAWLPLALAFPALLTIVNFIDKYIVERAVPDHRAMPVFAGAIGLIVALIALLLGGGEPLPAQDIVILLIGGILIIIGAVLYFRALSQEQASQVIILLQIAPVFVLILAWVLLGEGIGAQAFIGFWLILAAALGVAAQGGSKLRLSNTFALLMLANLQIAISTIILRLLITDPSFTTLLIYQGLGQGIGSAFIYVFLPPYRHAFNRALVEMPRLSLAVIGFNETLFLAARAIFNQSVTLGPAALVSVLSGTQAFYAILLGWILTLIAPQVFRESITRADLLRKAALAALLFVGLWLVVVGNDA